MPGRRIKSASDMYKTQVTGRDILCLLSFPAAAIRSGYGMDGLFLLGGVYLHNRLACTYNYATIRWLCCYGRKGPRMIEGMG